MSQVLGLFFNLLTLPSVFSIFLIFIKSSLRLNFVLILRTILLNEGSLGLGHAGVKYKLEETRIFMDISSNNFFALLIFLTLLPKFEPIAKKISIVLFVIVLLGAILAEKDNIVSYFADAGLITLALNVIMMIVAFYVAQLLATGNAQKKCIAIECGLQNGTLAIFVGTTLFGGGAFVIPAATYSLIMFATSLIFVYLVKNN